MFLNVHERAIHSFLQHTCERVSDSKANGFSRILCVIPPPCFADQYGTINSAVQQAVSHIRSSFRMARDSFFLPCCKRSGSFSPVQIP
jgi:hypothetical protein